MYNYDVNDYMRKYFAPNMAGDGKVIDVPIPADEHNGGEKPRKPRTRLSKWLAKIAGVYDGEMEPKTEAEYYLNEIAQKDSGSGGVFIVHTDGATLDKTMGEIQEARTRGDKIDIVQGNFHYTPVIFTDVYYDVRAQQYTGGMRIANVSGSFTSFKVNGDSETDALNAYPATRT